MNSKTDKSESFLKSFVAVGAATVINLVIGFLTTPVITRIVDPADNGKFSIFSMYTGLVITFFCFGLDQALVRFYYNKKELSYKRRIILEAAVIPVLATTFLMLLALIAVKLNLFKFEFDWFCTVFLAINIFTNVIFRFVLLVIRLNKCNSLYGAIQVLEKALYIVLALLFLIVLKMNGVYSLVVSTVSTVLVALVVASFSQREYLFGKHERPFIDKVEFKSMLRFGFPYIFSMGITNLFQSLDKMAINHYETYYDVGVYTSALTIMSLFQVLQTSFNAVWAPKSIEHYEKNPEEKAFYNTAFNAITVLMFGMGIALILFKDIIALLLGSKYREAAFYMPFLIFYPIMYTISETTVGGINFSKKSYLHIIIAAISCLCNFIGNTTLVPLIGCRGAAISTGISYIVFFLLRTILAERNYKVGFRLYKLFLLTFVVVGYAAYNSYFRFGIISILLALVCYFVLIICYRDTIKWGWGYLRANFSLKMFRKK